LYRAGLAFQVATPNWRRWKVTLFTGIATTIAALFPALVMQLLDFVALYGLILMPMGAVIFADYWLFPRLGLRSRWAEAKGVLFSWPAFLAWIGAVGFSFLLPIEIFFKALPAWFATVILYIALSWVQQRRSPAGAGAAGEVTA
jgi:purine-cytosine permease-like protein